ncbi:MAG: hypothetical protein U0414_25095 [Polyangiaceae bacterium]
MAAHLVEKVIPHVPTRQWVCSFPSGLRLLLGYDRSLCAEVLGAFAEKISRSLRWRAKRLFGLKSVETRTRARSRSCRRFDSALRLNVHSHVPALDGVDAQHDVDAGEAGELAFMALPAPSADEVLDVAQRTTTRLSALANTVATPRFVIRSRSARNASTIPTTVVHGSSDGVGRRRRDRQ